MEIGFTQIGVIKTEFIDSKGVPIQPRFSKTNGEVIINDEHVEGLQSLDGFSHIILLYWCHKSKPHKLKVTPYLDQIEHGVFATRAPSRPNSIGFSIVQLLSLEDNRIEFEGADILDNTPLLDIKPYVPEFDSYPEATSGWLTSRFSEYDEKKADKRFQDS